MLPSYSFLKVSAGNVWLRLAAFKAGRVVDEETLEEAVEWALKTFPQLAKIGKSAEYKGGFKFCRGSLKYRKMSYEIARFGKQVGVNLLRPKSKALTQVLHPLPVGEHISITDRWSYRNSKHLPSVAIRETMKHAANFRRFAASQIEEDYNYFFFTLPVSSSRIKVSELETEVDRAFAKEKQFEAEIAEEFGGTLEIVGIRLDLPYDASSRTVHPHFHGIAKSEGNICVGVFRDWLEEFTKSHGLNGNSCDLSKVEPEDLSKVVSYIFKPCLSAYSMAREGHAEEFRIFVGNLKKRLARTKGSFSAFNRKCNSAAKNPRGQREKAECEAELETDGQEKPNRERDCEANSLRSKRAPQNVLYGLSKLSPLPDGLLAVWSTVENFRPSDQGVPTRFGGASTLDIVNIAALQSWEENTGEEYSLKEFVRPFAKELLDLLEGSNVQYCTISCSAGVTKALREIKEEEQKLGERKISPGVNLKFWLKEKRSLGRVRSFFAKAFVRFRGWLRKNLAEPVRNAFKRSSKGAKTEIT